ncbi:MAG TPA: hypothetical protein VLX61_15285 [Anaerolineales bacterium]|nr:hypothetical protein [Anaerolineales bacterium]
MLIAVLVMAAVHFLLPISMIAPALWKLLGIIPLAVGLAVNRIADRAFHKANTSVNPSEQSTESVTEGIFGIT